MEHRNIICLFLITQCILTEIFLLSLYWDTYNTICSRHDGCQGLSEGGGGSSAGTSVRGPESREGACESLKGLSHRRFILIFSFFLVFATIFSLFRKLIMYNSLVTALYKLYVIWTFLWKFTSGFIGLQIFNFERSLSLSPGPQSSLVPPCKMSLGGHDGYNIAFWITFKTYTNLKCTICKAF